LATQPANHVMSCPPVMSCHVMSCRVLSCHAWKQITTGTWTLAVSLWRVLEANYAWYQDSRCPFLDTPGSKLQLISGFWVCPLGHPWKQITTGIWILGVSFWTLLEANHNWYLDSGRVFMGTPRSKSQMISGFWANLLGHPAGSQS